MMNEFGKKQQVIRYRSNIFFLLLDRSRSALLISGMIVFLSLSICTARSQTDDDTAQIIAPTVLSIESATESNLPIRVISPDNNAFVLIEGLPKAVALSTGRLFESGVWAVKVSDLEQLKIVAMANTDEQRDLVLSLKTLDGSVLAEVKSSLRISSVSQVSDEPTATSNEPRVAAAAPPLQEQETTEPDAVEPESAETESQPVEVEVAVAVEEPDREQVSATPVISDEEMEGILLMMRKGDENLQEGKINIARLFYSRAADKGWADAAFALARTYDEIELRKVGAIGVEPDATQAQNWYKRAVELGSTNAVAYLERLQ